MFERPFFQPDILENIYKFNLTTLTTRLWVPWIIIVAIVLGLCVRSLHKQLKIKGIYSSLFDSKIYSFNRHSLKDWLSLSFLVTAFISTAVYMFMCENSFFETADTMGLGTVRALNMGLIPLFDYYRVAPFAFWPLSTLYAITQNMYLIKVFILIQLLIVVFCLDALFRFIPVARRLSFLAVFLLTPTMFVTSKIIFPEREVLIALSLGLICLRRFCFDSKWRWLVGFLFFMNVAIYTKETCVLFYSGIFVASILYHIWFEKINLSSFIHPLKTIAQMPLEFLIAISLLLYSIIFFLLVDTSAETYFSNNSGMSLLDGISYYAFELILLSLALILLLKNALTSLNTSKNSLFKGGLVVGAMAVAVGIIFVLRLAPTTWFLAGKTYYLQITCLFALAYLFQHISKPLLLWCLAGLIVGYSLYMGYQNYQKEEGKYYRQVAEFLSEQVAQKTDKKLKVSLAERPDKITTEMWTIKAWQLIYSYYSQWSSYKIKIYPLMSYHQQKSQPVSSAPKVFQRDRSKDNSAVKEDAVVIHKKNTYPETLKLMDSLSPEPDFENRLFKVWLVK